MANTRHARWGRPLLLDGADRVDEARGLRTEILEFFHQDLAKETDSVPLRGQPGRMNHLLEGEEVSPGEFAAEIDEDAPQPFALLPAGRGARRRRWSRAILGVDAHAIHHLHEFRDDERLPEPHLLEGRAGKARSESFGKKKIENHLNL